MNIKKTIELLDKHIETTLVNYYNVKVGIFEKNLLTKIEMICEEEVKNFQINIKKELVSKREELIAEYLIKFELLTDPTCNNTYIIKVKE